MKRLCLLACAAAVAACERAPDPPPQTPARVAARPVLLHPEIAAFYASRGHRPLWMPGGRVTPAAEALLGLIAGAAAHGLDPQRYGAREAGEALGAARGGDRNAVARADLLLSRGYVALVRDLRSPPPDMLYVDEELAPAASPPGTLLAEAAAAPDLAAHLAAATRMNPLYEALRRGRERWRSAGAAGDEEKVRLNLARARAIPALEGRYVIVDTGSARLWMIDGRRIDGPMRAIVGKPEARMQTPSMAGLVRYATLNPYWNLPPDLARERARRVARQGPGVLARERLEVLDGGGRVVAPSRVDWAAFAAGRSGHSLRQLPGGANVMGAVKFMMPNELGIYLHDFPDKSLFARDDRRLSSGCVRVADAPRLARWLFGGRAPAPQGDRPEQNVDLPEPVPVYIVHLTVLPDPQKGLDFRPDGYGRDRTVLASR